MPNQFTKVRLFIEEDDSVNIDELSKLITISTVEVYKEKIPKNKEFINVIIKEIKENLHGGDNF